MRNRVQVCQKLVHSLLRLLLFHSKTYASCSYLQENNAFENGRVSNVLFPLVSADDFAIPAGENWLINEVQANFFTYDPANATAIILNFYADNTGLPGSILGADTILPVDFTMTFLGTNFGLSIYKYVMTLDNDIVLSGGSTYWFSAQVVNTTSSTDFYWETVNTGSPYGNNGVNAPTPAGPWTSPAIDNFVFELGYAHKTTIIESECEGFSVTVGTNVYNSTGFYVDTLTSIDGCDSIVEVDLTIFNVDAGVTQSGFTLNADLGGASYQWLDCNNAYAVIPSETNQSFTSAVNGSFAVEVTDGGCVDTSACYLLDDSGLGNEQKSVVTLYPNPSNNIVQLQGITQLQGVSLITITTITGEVVVVYSKAVSEIDLSALSAGVYFVNIQHENGLSSLKLVKE
ncbi:MAG: T9SS type A sorting domain-containing protein [Crocinitomicaceae bacterium]|nr:T9SS type A sorting domain-containing protein [Crocinitomicaceae bacterium]